jgi:23S rRNA (guanosine2251-2'-O)-methyltransferase
MGKRKSRGDRRRGAAGERPLRAPRAYGPRASDSPKSRPDSDRDRGRYWIVGHHAVAAALANAARGVLQIRATPEAAAALAAAIAARTGHGRSIALTETDRAELDLLVGADAVHQGVALLAEPLDQPSLDEVTAATAARPRATVVLLDQVTDPHNVGAILRSAAAFGAAAVVTTERHAAPEGAGLAKAASGALDLVPLVRVVNLARALDRLKAAGYWCVGLAADATLDLPAVDFPPRVALVLGAEGSGLRRLTRETCDLLVRLPALGSMAQINVSNAAAIALYELHRRAIPGNART